MCRAAVDGGRRCPCGLPEHRNARRRGTYAAAKAARSAGIELPPEPEQPELRAPSMTEVRRATNWARTAVRRLTQAAGADAVTTGLAAEAETAVTTAGVTIAAYVDAQVADALADIERRSAEDPDVGDGGISEAIARTTRERDEAVAVNRAATSLSVAAEARDRSILLDRRLRQLVESPWVVEALEARREATWAVLGQLRPMGPAGPMKVADGASKLGTQVVESVATYYPTEWVAASDEHEVPLSPRLSDARAHYAHNKRKRSRQRVRVRVTWLAEDAPVPEDMIVVGHGPHGVAVADRSQLALRQSPPVGELTLPSPRKYGEARAREVAAHEFAHRSEAVRRQLGLLECAFLARRCSNTATGAPAALVSLYGRRSERAMGDHFADAYVGKVYAGTQYREVLSTGMQALVGGAFGGLVGLGDRRADPDHRAFVLGLLAAA